jgi:hypothetical protein|nr:MAG: hypothetical protein [uncultured cyanophage]
MSNNLTEQINTLKIVNPDSIPDEDNGLPHFYTSQGYYMFLQQIPSPVPEQTLQQRNQKAVFRQLADWRQRTLRHDRIE